MFYINESYKKKVIKSFAYILIPLSVLFLISCNNNKVYDHVIEEYSTDKKSLYNLYFFYSNSEDSLEIKKEFSNWNRENYPNVYNTRSYDISSNRNVPSQAFLEVFKISEEDTPVFIMFNNTGVVLRTDKFDDVLYYLDNRNK